MRYIYSVYRPRSMRKLAEIHGPGDCTLRSIKVPIIYSGYRPWSMRKIAKIHGPGACTLSTVYIYTLRHVFHLT